ncbi:TrmH family RNA methyltransferase [Vulgatibacter sp.]|uniref:TrmH family RNA methyltransferase n=1 Tax=Vulgatibacter sp. TaxID=1971226 RepID=UPI00356327E6
MRPADLLTDERLARIERVVAGRTRSLTVVLEEVHDPHNHSAVLRTAECFGVQDVHVVEGPRSPFHTAKLVARGADKWVDVHRSRDVVATIRRLQGEGFRVLASRLDGASTPLHDLPHGEKLALVFGNESVGVSPEAIAACDGSFVVPMFGFTQSLNISVAVAVSLSWLTLHRAREKGGLPGDLPAAEARELEERFSFQAVRQRRRIFGHKKPPPELLAQLRGEEEDG